MADELYDISWGSVRLWCSSISTVNSRTQVIHALATGDDHPVQDRGAAPRVTRCSLLFDEMPGEARSALARFLEFKAQVDSGEEHVFVHPVDGGYFAKVGEFTYDIDEDENIVNVSCEFIPNQVIAAVLQPGLGTLPGAGFDAVEASAADLLADLEDSNIVSTVPQDAIDAIAGWQEEGITTRDILVSVAELSDSLASLIEDQELEGDLALFDCYRSAIMLGEAIRAAAVGATSETSSIFFLKIATPQSVLALVVRIYGGAEAEDRERQVRALNDIRTPGGLLDSGTELAMPSPTVRRAA